MPWFVWLALGLLLVFVADRLLLRAEDRGWIYWRKNTPSRQAIGNALLGLHSIYEPDKQHVVEERLRQEADIEQAEDGEPRD